MADDVMREFLVSILTKFDEASNKQALGSVDKQQAQITDREKKGQGVRAKNLASALGDATKQVGQHAKAVLQFGEKISLGLAGVVASVEGAAVAGTFALARLSGEMKAAYYSGQKLGAAVKDMDAFRYASEQAGSSAAKAQAGLEELGHLRNTNPAAYVGLLQRLGVAATDAAGKLRSPAQAAMDLAPALAKLPRNMQLLFGNQLGMDDDQTLAMVRPEFLAQIKQYQEMQKKIGFDPDKAAADGAKFQQIWTKMWAAVDIVSKKVQSAFFNQVGGSVDRVTDLLVKNSGRITDIAIKIGDYVLHLATSIIDLIGNFDKLNPTTQRFIEVMAGVAAVLLTLRAGPIGIIMALAAALAFLWDDYEKYKDGLPSVVDWEKWEPKIKAAVKGLTDLWTKFDDLAVKLTGQGGLQVAMEAFAAYMATTWVTKLVGAFASVSKAWAPLAAMLAAAGYLANNTADPLGGGRDMSWGEGAARFLDPGAADRLYGKGGEQQVHGPRHGVGTKAAPHDTRTLWQRTMPKWAGGKDAPTAAGPADPNLPVGNAPGASGYGAINAYWKGPLDKRGEGGHTGPKEMFDYLKSQGASDNEALLLTGSAASESSFNPNAVHDNGTGHGLFGHKDTRLDMRGKNWQQQSVLALGELRRTLGSRVAAARTPEELTDIEMHNERPRGYKSNNPRAGDNYMGRLNSIRRFSALTGHPTAQGDASHPYAERTFGRYLNVTRPMAARGEMPYPHGHVPEPWRKLAAAMTSGVAAPSLPSLPHGLMASPSSLYQAYDTKRSTTVSPTVNQNVNIHGVQNPHDIGNHLKVHAKRGVQDAIRSMQGPSQ